MRPWRLGFNEERPRIAEAAERVSLDMLDTMAPGMADARLGFTFRVGAHTITEAINLQELGRFSGQEIFGGRLSQRIAERMNLPTSRIGLVNLM